jgi:diacylglycerol kinase family enzyme
MRAIVLINAGAGTAVSRGDAALREEVAALCGELGLSAEVKTVPSAELERELALAAGQAQTELVIVGGGDGTIRTGAGVLAGSGKAMGVLPLGTLNHFARDLGMPSPLAEALAAIAHGAVREVDVAEVNGATFVNNCSIGLYAEAVLVRERLRRHRGIAKWPAMVVGAGTALRRFRVSRLWLQTPEWKLSLRTPQLVIGNNRYQTDRLALGQRGRLDRGELWVYAALDEGRFGFLRLILRALGGRLDAARDFYSRCAAELALDRRRSGRRIRLALDGELAVMRGPLRFRIRPGALKVRAPAPSA